MKWVILAPAEEGAELWAETDIVHCLSSSSPIWVMNVFSLIVLPRRAHPVFPYCVLGAPVQHKLPRMQCSGSDQHEASAYLLWSDSDMKIIFRPGTSLQGKHMLCQWWRCCFWLCTLAAGFKEKTKPGSQGVCVWPEPYLQILVNLGQGTCPLLEDTEAALWYVSCSLGISVRLCGVWLWFSPEGGLILLEAVSLTLFSRNPPL
jgi:hypothetical protein